MTNQMRNEQLDEIEARLPIDPGLPVVFHDEAVALVAEVRSLLVRLQEAEAERDRLRDENAARLWHRPHWTSSPFGSLNDGNCIQCGQHWPCTFVKNTAAQAFAERDELRARLAAVEAMHYPRTGTCYSMKHHEAEHESEDERCDESCFEPWTSCNADGSQWPCSTARAIAAAVSSPADQPHRIERVKFYPDAEEEPLIFVDVDDE